MWSSSRGRSVMPFVSSSLFVSMRVMDGSIAKAEGVLPTRTVSPFLPLTAGNVRYQPLATVFAQLVPGVPLVVAGWSFGVNTAFELAVRHPEQPGDDERGERVRPQRMVPRIYFRFRIFSGHRLCLCDSNQHRRSRAIKR